MWIPVPLAAATIVILLVLVYQVRRRLELAAMRRTAEERVEARERGSHKAPLRHPFIDLSRCFGCGACVRACPEDGVLGLIHGQAAVLHGARCVGHGLCAQACPVEAVALTLGDVKGRTDLPAVTEKFEAVGVPGLYLAGEVTGHALIRTAVAQGTTVADAIADRPGRRPKGDALDLCIVGAGPAGLACSLQAKARGLDFVTLDRESLGGTVARYPRRKLVMTQPVELPLVGRLSRLSYEKEQLMEVWADAAKEHGLPIRTVVDFLGLDRGPDGTFTVRTNVGDHKARTVVLALGRRGTPRKLGVPGESLDKVAYNLLDANAYSGRRLLVVGGGDSAVEAAMAFADQEGNEVTISYRQAAFSRLKARNEKRLDGYLRRGRIALLMESSVIEIAKDRVRLRVGDRELELENDHVFVMIGGTPPFDLLKKSGVSFDLSKAPPPPRMMERGTDAIRGITAAFLFVAAAWIWFGLFRGYYPLPPAQRALHPLHGFLRSSGTFGLGCALAACLLIGANLLYLPRRWLASRSIFGSLRAWMTSHIATGTLAFLLLLFHAGLSPQPTSGGYALALMAAIAATGAIGRYLYAFVPRAANGAEAAVDEVRAELAAVSSEWDRHGRAFSAQAMKEIQQLVDSAAWRPGFFGSLAGLLRDQRRLRGIVRRLRLEGRREGLTDGQVSDLAALAERSHRAATMAARYENLRGLMNTWRHLHRGAAVVMLVLAVLHIVSAVRHADLSWFPWR